MNAAVAREDVCLRDWVIKMNLHVHVCVYTIHSVVSPKRPQVSPPVDSDKPLAVGNFFNGVSDEGCPEHSNLMWTRVKCIVTVILCFGRPPHQIPIPAHSHIRGITARSRTHT